MSQRRASPRRNSGSPIRSEERNLPLAATNAKAAEYIKNNTEFRLHPNLKNLDLSNLNIESLPSWIGNLSELKRLNLSFNKLRSIPPELFKEGALPKLQTLDLSHNQLTSLPPFKEGALPNLEILDLSQNKLTSLPPFKEGALPNLKILDLSQNKLTSLPPKLFKEGALPNLKILHLSYNQLTSLSPDLFKEALLNLKELYLSYNQLTSIHPNLFKDALPNLRWLYLDNNQLTYIPETLNIRIREGLHVVGLNDQDQIITRRRSPSPTRRTPSPQGNHLNLQEDQLTRRTPSPVRLQTPLAPIRQRSRISPQRSPTQTSPIVENVECSNTEDIFGIDDFSEGSKEYEAENRVIILNEKGNKGTCYGEKTLIKSLFQLYGSEGDVPMTGPYVNQRNKGTNRYFKLPPAYWIDLEGVKLVLEGYKVLRLKKLREEAIGSEDYVVSGTHGEVYPIYTLRKVRGFKEKNKFHMKVMFDNKLQVIKEEQFGFEGTEVNFLTLPKIRKGKVVFE